MKKDTNSTKPEEKNKTLDNDKISQDDIKYIQENLKKTAKHDLKEFKKRQKKAELDEKKKKKEEEKKKRQKEKEIALQEKEEELRQKKIKRIKLIVFIILCLIGCIIWSRYMSTSGLIVKEYPITTSVMPKEYDGLKIVHFSDVHYGTIVHGGELENLVKKINDQHPDIVVFTGDLIDKTTMLTDEDITYITNVLKEINPKIETIAVTGNHDYSNDYFKKITDNLDWIVLDNKYEYVYYNSTYPIIFVGLEDYSAGKPDYKNAFSFLNEVEEQTYTIVLMHEPDQIKEIQDHQFDLVFAGHSMLGQVRLPFVGSIYRPYGARKYYEEKYIVDDKEMYINGGIGTNYIKHRFLNKPSINLYRFYVE